MHQYCFTYLMVKLRGMEMFRQSVEKSPKRRVGRTRAVGKHLEHSVLCATCQNPECVRCARFAGSGVALAACPAPCEMAGERA